jgi:hypothetical protein
MAHPYSACAGYAPLNTPRDEGSQSDASKSWGTLAALLNSMVTSEPASTPTMRAHKDFYLIQNSVAPSKGPQVDPDIFTHELSYTDSSSHDALSITTADISDISGAAGLATSAAAAHAAESSHLAATGIADPCDTGHSNAAYGEAVHEWLNEDDEYADIEDLHQHLLSFIGDGNDDLMPQAAVDAALHEDEDERAYISAWSDEYAEDIKISIQAGATDSASSSHADVAVVTDVPGAGVSQDVYFASDDASMDDWAADLYAPSDDQQQAQPAGSDVVADIKVTVTVTEPSSDGEEARAAHIKEETWVAVDGPGDHVVLLRGHQTLLNPRHGQQSSKHPIVPAAGSSEVYFGGDAIGMQPMYGDDADKLSYQTELEQAVVDDFQTVIFAIKLVAAQAALLAIALVLHMWCSTMLEARISKLEAAAAAAVLPGKTADLV